MFDSAFILSLARFILEFWIAVWENNVSLCICYFRSCYIVVADGKLLKLLLLILLLLCDVDSEMWKRSIVTMIKDWYYCLVDTFAALVIILSRNYTLISSVTSIVLQSCIICFFFSWQPRYVLSLERGSRWKCQ